MAGTSTGVLQEDGGSTEAPEGDTSSGSPDESTDAGTTAEPEACVGIGGEPLRLGYIKLQPPTFLPDTWALQGEFTCTIADVEATDDFFISDDLAWITRLQCEDLGELEIVAQQEIEMFDPSWVGRSVTVTADAGWAVWFRGWYAIRDDQGELLFAHGSSLPPAGVTAPFTVERINLGESCAFNESCLILYQHMVAFTSEADGTLHCYDYGGYATDDYWIEGSSSEYYNPDPLPFGECDVADLSGGINDYFRILRRMGS